MSAKNIVFSNLRAEMARNGIAVQDIGSTLGVNRDTAGRKLAGKSPITLSEAFKIAKTHFPDCDVRYLFHELVGHVDSGGEEE